MNTSKQLKTGAVLSYVTIIFNILAGVLYTPWMISKIGQDKYGLYTLATSLIAMFVMDFGMGAAVSKFVARYNAEGNQKGADNFLGVIYKLYLLIDAVIFVALLLGFLCINTIYAKLTTEELRIFKGLYLIVGFFSIISFPFTNLNGILMAYEKFVQLKYCELFNRVFTVVMMIIALLGGYGVFSLVSVNAVVGILTIFLKLYMVRRHTKVRVNFKYFDKSLIKEIFSFSLWTAVWALAQRLIFNITPSIIAAVSSNSISEVAIFGLSTTIESYVYTIATAINGMFMTRISKIIVEGKKEKELLPLMVRIGRIQYMLIGIIVIGFITVGKTFIVDIWNKPDFIGSYYCSVLLIIPSLFFLPMQIANTTLIVENKVNLQVYVILITGIINFVFSLFLSKLWGALGASVSIFIAYMIRIILFVAIYSNVLKLDMVYFSKQVFLKLSPYLLVTFLFGTVVEIYNPIINTYFRFIVNIFLMVCFFGVLMMVNGFNKYEKQLLGEILNKLCKRK